MVLLYPYLDNLGFQPLSLDPTDSNDKHDDVSKNKNYNRSGSKYTQDPSDWTSVRREIDIENIIPKLTTLKM